MKQLLDPESLEKLTQWGDMAHVVIYSDCSGHIENSIGQVLGDFNDLNHLRYLLDHSRDVEEGG